MSEQNIQRIMTQIQNNPETPVESIIAQVMAAGFSYDECKAAVKRLGLSPIVLPPGYESHTRLPVGLILMVVCLIGFLSIAVGAYVLKKTSVPKQDVAVLPTMTPAPATPTPAAPIQKEAPQRVVFRSRTYGFATADIKGDSIKPLYTGARSELLVNIADAQLSPDRTKIYIETVDDPTSEAPQILNYVLDLRSSTLTDLPTDDVTKSIGTYRYIIFSSWTADSRHLLFEATNDLPGTDTPSDKVVGLYDITAKTATFLFTKNALFLGEIAYNPEKKLVSYLEGYGSLDSKPYTYDMNTSSHLPMVFTADQKVLSISPDLETVIGISSTSNAPDFRWLALYPYSNLVQPIQKVELQEGQDFEYQWVPNPIWSADGNVFMITVRQARGTPVQKVQFITRTGAVLSTVDVSDYKTSEGGLFYGETRPVDGIFSPDNKYFLLMNQLSISLSQVNWRLIEVATGTVTNANEVTAELGAPIGWIE